MICVLTYVEGELFLGATVVHVRNPEVADRRASHSLQEPGQNEHRQEVWVRRRADAVLPAGGGAVDVVTTQGGVLRGFADWDVHWGDEVGQEEEDAAERDEHETQGHGTRPVWSANHRGQLSRHVLYISVV